MGSRSNPVRLLLLVVMAVAIGTRTVPATPPDEAALLQLWRVHQDPATTPSSAIKEAGAFETRFSQSPFVIIARGLIAWYQLKAGHAATAEPILTGLLSSSDDPVHRGGDRLARHWLTRLDREQVKRGLAQAYAEAIRYPDNLPPGIKPATDRWGEPWVYQLTPTKFFKGAAAQTYSLESPRLAPLTDLTKALAIPYGSQITLRPVQVDGDVVTLAPPGGDRQFVLSPGALADQIMFVYAGDTLLILSDGDHWLVLPRQ